MFYRVACGSSTARSRAGRALNRVKGMPFDWSLNPYTGCAHRCTFCYVRAFEARADRPSDDRYGRSIRVKVNVAEVLRARARAAVLEAGERRVGAATDPYQPAEGRYRLTRACIRELGAARTPFSLITRGPMVRRDVDVLVEAAAPREGARQLLGADARRADLAGDRARHGAAAADGSRRCASSPRRGSTRVSRSRRSSPGSPTTPKLLAEVVREARAAGASGDLGERPLPAARHAGALPRGARARLARAAARVRAALRGPGVPAVARDRRDPSLVRRLAREPWGPRRPTDPAGARARAARARP